MADDLEAFEGLPEFVAAWRRVGGSRTVSVRVFEAVGAAEQRHEVFAVVGSFEDPEAFVAAFKREWAAYRARLEGPVSYVASDPRDPPTVVRVRLHDGRPFALAVPESALLTLVERAAAVLPALQGGVHARSRALLREPALEEMVRWFLREWARWALAPEVLRPGEPAIAPPDLPAAVQEEVAAALVRHRQMLEVEEVRRALHAEDSRTVKRFLRERLSFPPSLRWDRYRVAALWRVLRRPGWRRVRGDVFAYLHRAVAMQAATERRAASEMTRCRRKDAKSAISKVAARGFEPRT